MTAVLEGRAASREQRGYIVWALAHGYDELIARAESDPSNGRHAEMADFVADLICRIGDGRLRLVVDEEEGS